MSRFSMAVTAVASASPVYPTRSRVGQSDSIVECKFESTRRERTMLSLILFSSVAENFIVTVRSTSTCTTFAVMVSSVGVADVAGHPDNCST